MHDTLTFALPTGYRVTTPERQAMVECERGCGWKLSVTLLSGFTDETREQLFRYHEQWHAKK